VLLAPARSRAGQTGLAKPQTPTAEATTPPHNKALTSRRHDLVVPLAPARDLAGGPRDAGKLAADGERHGIVGAEGHGVQPRRRGGPRGPRPELAVPVVAPALDLPAAAEQRAGELVAHADRGGAGQAGHLRPFRFFGRGAAFTFQEGGGYARPQIP
jgi:hypothetical protein